MGYIRMTLGHKVMMFCPLCEYAEKLWMVPIEFGNIDFLTYYPATNKPVGWDASI